ncbi:MAG: outer membrane protein [Roseicyclus sp.]
MTSRISTRTSGLALALAMAFGAAPALAGGMGEPAAPPVTVPAAPAPVTGADWTGAYGGVQLEYGDADLSGLLEEDGTGALGGIFGGYRYDFGSYVVGAELDLNLADIDLDAAGGNIDAVYRLGLEAGFDAGPALIYGTAGAAVATLDADTDTLRGHGYFYGVGVDYAVTDQVTVGAELLQHEFDDFDGVSGLDADALTFGVNAALRF